MNLSELYRSRPFKTRNADEFGLEEVLNRFVNPLNEILSPYEYESTIIRGKKGTGKTMYLRANHAIYQHSLFNSLSNNEDVIVPIYLPLSRYSNLKDAEIIYQNIIRGLCEALLRSYKDICDVSHMLSIHGILNRVITSETSFSVFSEGQKQLIRCSAEEIKEITSSKIVGELGIKSKLVDAKATLDSKSQMELIRIENFSINLLNDLNENLLGAIDFKLLVLLDEVGSLAKDFFIGERDRSPFEILMNQFRTSGNIRTKIAVYPDTGSDRLNETRYGNKINLEEEIKSDLGYKTFRNKSQQLINNYINVESNGANNISDVFDLNEIGFADCLEQLINSSGGNTRLLIKLLDQAMIESYSLSNGEKKVSLKNSNKAIMEFANNAFSELNTDEQEMVNEIVRTCKSRQGFRFTYRYNTIVLNSICTKSDEYNTMGIEKIGTGRSPTVYNLEYSFCVLNEIPTHVERDSNKIDPERSLRKGKWSPRLINVADQNPSETSDFKKGMILDIQEDGKGHITDADKKEYVFWFEDVIEENKSNITVGKNVAFKSVLIIGGLNVAYQVNLSN